MIAYHTQEKRNKTLSFPLKCVRDDAWLGEAYYFWKEEFDAFNWGNSSKKGTGFFEIYQCDINSEDYLDTVFNEEHYYFWFAQLEKIATVINEKTGEKPTLKELNDYIRDKNVWPQVDYIQFQDLPVNAEQSFVKPVIYGKNKVRIVTFRKRIQIAVYNTKTVSNFALIKTEKVKK